MMFYAVTDISLGIYLLSTFCQWNHCGSVGSYVEIIHISGDLSFSDCLYR